MTTAAASPPPADLELLGVRLRRLTEAQTIAVVLEGLGDGEGGWVCPVNVDVLRQCAADTELRELVNAADVVVADGMPLVWAGQLAGRPVPERVPGSTLIWSLSTGAARENRSVFLLGGDPGAAEAAAGELRRREPELRIAGTLCPPFGFERDGAELARIRAALEAAVPDIVFVGLGFPKQDRLALGLREVLPRAWFVSCGISFSFVSGEVRRAPAAIQRLGLEWLHRLVQEPKRLAKRYLVHGPPAVARLLLSALAVRLRASGRSRPGP